MSSIDDLVNKALSYEGYLEKASNSSLDSFTANAGSANYTCFARDYKIHTGISVQAQPWCDVFVDMMFIMVFGTEKAKKMLGGFSAYTPTSAQYFKNMGRWYTSGPKKGDVIFFKNSIRIYHTGIVVKVTSSKIYTIEGNTSGASEVVANGGGVCQKSYSLSYSSIAGYGRPDYPVEIVKNGWTQEGKWYYYESGQKKTGWLKYNDKWYFLNPDGAMVANDWTQQENKWYFLSESGIMVDNDWILYKGKWYFINPGGIMVSNAWTKWNEKWYYLGENGVMQTGWLNYQEKWYYLNSAAGDMAVNTTTPDGYQVGADGVRINE